MLIKEKNTNTLINIKEKHKTFWSTLKTLKKHQRNLQALSVNTLNSSQPTDSELGHHREVTAYDYCLTVSLTVWPNYLFVCQDWEAFYLFLSLNLKCLSQSSRLTPSSYLVRLTSLSKEAKRKLKRSLKQRFVHAKVMNFSLFCAMTSILFFSDSSCALWMIRCAS